MPTPALVVELALVLAAAALGGAIAVRLRASPIVGYVLAGIVIGPYTPGLVGDVEVVRALADVGVVFLMFTVGARISLRDLARVGPLGILGALVQVIVVLGAGWLVGMAIGLTSTEAVFLGAVASNSSSTVLTKVLGERGESGTEHGHAALAWSTVQDFATIVLVIVLMSLTQSPRTTDEGPWIAVLTAAAFLAVAVVAGGRLMHALFERLVSVRDREVIVLGVAAAALGTALVASMFGVPLAIGAFLAGAVLAESDLSSRVTGEALPFRDLFAGVFFVSIGMLVDPLPLLLGLPTLATAVALIVMLKGSVVAVLLAAMGRSRRFAILTGAILAQCAEFSFVMASMGHEAGVIGRGAFNLMLGAAAASVILSPTVVHLAQRLALAPGRPVQREPTDGAAVGPEDTPRAVLCGFGRVGHVVGAGLERLALPYTVIEDDRRTVEDLRARGVRAIHGSASNRSSLEAADLQTASVLVIALPDLLTVRLVVHEARRLAPDLPIVARAHDPREREGLLHLGVEVVVGEEELGVSMVRLASRRMVRAGGRAR